MSNAMEDLISGQAMLDDEEDDESFDDGEPREARHGVDDSSEEDDEDEDEEEALRVAEGFIVDEGEDDEDDEDDEDAEDRRRRRKRRREQREEEEQLDEDDLDLIGETNDWNRKPSSKSGGRTLKRLKQGHSRDQDRTEKDALAEIFSDEDEYGNEDQGYARTSHRMQGDELDDFIEDDYPEDDEERRQHEADLEVARPGAKVGRHTGLDTTGLDADALEDMQLIFGDGNDYDWALEAEEVQEDERREQIGIELKDVFEPSQLAEKMLTDEDNEIRVKDDPERFQLWRKPIEHITIDDAQFKEETRWIVNLIWPRKRDLSPELQPAFTQAVRRVLEFVVVDQMEVPYIFQHRKDYLIHERKNDAGELTNIDKLLNQDDLWKIIELDIKFRGLIEKRNALERTYINIKEVTGENDKTVDDMMYKACTMEELQDIQDYVNFRYAKEVREISLAEGMRETKRPGAKTSQWLKMRESRACGFVKAYGLGATQLGVNAYGEGPRTTPEDEKKLPMDLADDLCDEFFETGEAVMQAARQMFAEELACDPMMRRYFRRLYYLSATVSSSRTEKGLRKIDEAHPYYEIKYMVNQAMDDLARHPELFLKMMKAEEEGLVEVKLQLQDSDDQMRRLLEHFKSENQSEIAEAWNDERARVLELAFPKLERVIARGVKDSLRTSCQDEILLACRTEYSKRLDRAPYKPHGLALGTTPRILAFSNGMGDVNRDPTYWTSVEEDGKLLEHGTFTNLQRDESQRNEFVELVLRKASDVIAVSGYCADSHRLVADIKALVRTRQLMSNEYEDEDSNKRIDPLEVVVVNDEVARLYKDNPRGAADFPNLHPVTRYCFALCRYMQNPLKEYAALGKDITTLTFHPCQHLVPQDKLARYLETSMVDMVNLIGVEINEAVNDQYTANLLPHIAGLGPRKAQHVVKLINASGGRITSREELVGDPDSNKVQIVGPRVFNNCSSFLYIDYDSTNRDSDPLDNTRVHPEDYELGRKMAADALEIYDEDVKMETDEHGPAAIVRILFRDEQQDKVNDLVLEEYAEQLERKFQQRKRATLETIRAELLVPYEELRTPFAPLDDDAVFQMFTGETKESFKPGVILPAVIRHVRDDYALVKFDNGLEGRINSQDVAHRHSLKDALHVGQTVRGVLMEVTRSDFKINFSLREEEIRRAENLARANRSHQSWWDARKEDKDRESLQVRDKTTGRAMRVIKHPKFKTHHKTQAEEFLGQAAIGDAVIRPSSLGSDHITITWKVANGVFQHLDVLELEKENEFSVGKKLRVGTHIYSDLDELINDHVQAMGKKIHEMMTHDKWYEGSKSVAEKWLNSYCAANPHRSNYRFCIDPKHPGYFFLLFKASKKAQATFWMVKIIPQGYEMMKNKYPDMKALCNGFKMMFQAEATKQLSRGGGGEGGERGASTGGKGPPPPPGNINGGGHGSGIYGTGQSGGTYGGGGSYGRR